MATADVEALPPIHHSPRGRTVHLLRELIVRGEINEGERLPAETRLAEQFNVSRMTLRAALQVLEREGLVRRERNIGCVRAGRQPNQTNLMSRTIVLLSDHRIAKDGGVFGGTSDALVSGVIDGVVRRDMHFFRVGASVEDDRWLVDLISARPKGVVASFWNRPEPWQIGVINRLKSAGLHVAAFGHSSLFDGVDTVRTDHESGTEALVHVLAKAGKRRILRAWSAPTELPWIQAHDRGYDRAVRELGLDFLPPIQLEGLLPREAEGETNFRIRARHFAGYLAEHLHNERPIDALMVATDWEALVALAACRLFGRTDLPVVGYDNYWPGMYERRWEPGVPYATVEKNNHLLGESLVDLLLQRIDGALPANPQTRVIEQRVVVS